MPSSVTHKFFCEDVFKSLNKNIKNTFRNDINMFYIFGQGPDPYFFYDFHLTKRSKKVYLINNSMQQTKTNLHFTKLINYINDNNYYDNSQVLSYLYGQICHFVLDSTTHPYIIYTTGIYDKKNAKTYKYNGMHEEMEYYIDCYLINKRKKIKPKYYKAYKELFKIDKFNNELNHLIDETIKNVYNYENASSIYYKSIKDMKKFYYVFNYDPIGIKKIAYCFLDLICQNKCVRKKELSFNINPNSKLYYLNLDKKDWFNPCDSSIKSNKSFLELYDDAAKKASNIITEIDKMLKRKVINNKKIEDLFLNLSYATGLDCNIDSKFKYFKF